MARREKVSTMNLIDWLVLAAALLIMGLCWWTLAKHDEVERIIRQREMDALDQMLRAKERRDEEARRASHSHQ
jgi:flagellar biosynthesis/type III secretory pathway M-ring protein FliF/YscJ